MFRLNVLLEFIFYVLKNLNEILKLEYIYIYIYIDR